MARIPIDNLGKFGFIPDMLPHDIPPEAWSEAKNVRVFEGALQKITGERSVYGTPSVAPHGLFPIATAADLYWVYMSLTKAYAVDSSYTHADITRASGGNYAAGEDVGWTGGAFNGVGIFNNGVDAPQQWIPPGLSQQLEILANWPSGYLAQSMRPYKAYMLAMDIYDGSKRYPFDLMWSDSVDAGVVPTSWDESDATVDTGRVTLGDTNGFILDSLPLGTMNVVYKEDQLYRMVYVGGSDIFDFRRIDDQGMLSRNCAASYYHQGAKHAVFGPDDLYIHDGNSLTSIADTRVRRRIANTMSDVNFRRSFVVSNPQKTEIWFCYPTRGATYADRALIWNWKDNVFCGERELPGCRIARSSRVKEDVTVSTWSTDSQAWDNDVTEWDAKNDPARRTILLADTTNTRLKQCDRTNQFDGVSFTSYVKRTGLAIARQDRQGAPKADSSVVKLLLELWPRIEAPDGTVFTIYCGSHDYPSKSGSDTLPEDKVVWNAGETFTVGQQEAIYPSVSGRYLALWIQTSANVEWKFQGYDLELEVTGKLNAPAG